MSDPLVRLRPKIVASRGTLRLVHVPRDEKSWPNISDLYLERLVTDAMGEPLWSPVESWCLSEISQHDSRTSAASRSIAALKMLLDPGPVEKKE